MLFLALVIEIFTIFLLLEYTINFFNVKVRSIQGKRTVRFHSYMKKVRQFKKRQKALGSIV